MNILQSNDITFLLNWVEKRLEEEKEKQEKEKGIHHYCSLGGKIRAYKEIKDYIISHSIKVNIKDKKP